MAKIELLICDNNEVHVDEHIPASTITVVYDGIPIQADLCPSCAEPVHGAFAMLQHVGRKPDRFAVPHVRTRGKSTKSPTTKPQPADKPYECKYCTLTYHKPARLVSHYVSKHPDSPEAQPDAPYPSLRGSV